MLDLIKQERFEIEVLERLNSKKLLDNLLFTGGTMLRLCFGLNRFSVDLDFWLAKRTNTTLLYKKIYESLAEFYKIRDSANKFHTILFEIKSPDYPRALKIEIRKIVKKIKSAIAIAYSKYAEKQVLLKVVSPEEMMKAKIEAFLERKEIRDVFDIEFLLKMGTELPKQKRTLRKLLEEIENLNERDYKIKLGSIIEEQERRYYIKENFKILKMKVMEKINL